MNQGRDLLAPSCPNCGAKITAAISPGARVVCHYCGQAFQAPAEINPAPRIIVVTPGMRSRPAPRRAVGRSILSLFFSFLLIGVLALIQARGRSHAIANLSSSVASNIVSAVASNFMWDTVAGPPIPAAVGSGAEGFVGRIRVRGEDTLWIAAFDGSKLAPIWKAGPLGTYTQGYQSTFTSVVGRVVVVTDYRAKVHVYDLASGHETRTIALTDRAKAMCPSPDGKARVWLEMSDEKNVLVDADLGTSTLAPRPAWCPEPSSTIDDCRGWLKRGAPRLSCKGPEGAPKVNSFEAKNVVEDGDLAVVLGRKHPGTGVPIAVGFDPKTKAVRWEQPVASGDQTSVAEANVTSIMDALAGGRFVAPYELTSKGWHFTAFDARSGQRLWDVPLQSLIGVEQPEGFALSASRVYVMRTSSLEVYDAKTGTLVGTIGG
jgi:uncharacterized Zn-finger protein